MKKRLIATALLFSATFASQAQEPTASQWKPVEWPLFQLVQNGYRIVTVGNAGTSGEAIYILQKDNDIMKCPDARMSESAFNRSPSAFNCSQLVMPHGARPK